MAVEGDGSRMNSWTTLTATRCAGIAGSPRLGDPADRVAAVEVVAAGGVECAGDEGTAVRRERQDVRDHRAGDGTTSTEPNPTHTYATAGAYQARLTVSDGVKSSISTPITISAGSVPTATILTPTDGAQFQAGGQNW